jgi:uncharacterized protein (DUF1015 family)
MRLIHPFRGVLPLREKVSRIISKPYDKYHLSEVKDIVKENPDSFLHVIKPELASGKRTKADNSDAQKKSRLKFLEFLQNGVLQKVESDSYFIYRQVKPNFVYTGLLATIDAAAYRDGRIKIHEQTLAPKEGKLKDYLKVVGINAEPVMFTYPHKHDIDELMNRLTFNIPYADFHFDGKQHLLWQVSSPSDVSALQSAFESIQKVYVADGHHRSASSVLLAEEMAELHPGASRFMGIFIPDHNLQLFEFNRLIKDTGGLSKEEIIALLTEDFEVTLQSITNFQPARLHEFSMYIDSNWYSLKLKHSQINDQLGDKLDANILSQRILAPIFGIADLRNDNRVDFMSGLNGTEELKNMVDSGKFAVAFGLFPVSFEQFFDFSDRGKMMPPKTTWFEPKLLNGLVIYDLELEG